MIIAEAKGGENPILLANQAFLDLTGLELGEVIGQDCRFLQGPGTSKEVIAEISESLKSGGDVNVELLNYRKDGSSFWNRLHISPICDDDGQTVYYFASQLDVTETHRIEGLEASERRLLREVDHRSKNVLAVVNSIVRLSNSEDPAQYATSIRDRVEALAGIHVLLSAKAWQAVPLGEVIQQQIKHGSDRRTELTGPSDVTVDASIAQPVALVIHELFSNAQAHGSLAGPLGKLSISWRPLPSGGFEIDWRETGGKISATIPKTGLGFILVDGIVERQLGGAIARSWADEGLSVVINLPA